MWEIPRPLRAHCFFSESPGVLPPANFRKPFGLNQASTIWHVLARSHRFLLVRIEAGGWIQFRPAIERLLNGRRGLDEGPGGIA